MQIVSSRDELLSEADKLRGDGWTVLPADDPERATVGYIGFRGEPEDEEVQELVWPFLGKVLEPQNITES